MLKAKITKATVLALSMSLMLAIPVYANTGVGQSVQNNMNNMQNNGQFSNITPGGITQNGTTPGAISPGGITQDGTTPGAIGPGGITQDGTTPGAITQNATTQLSSAAQYMVAQGIIKGSSDGNYNMSGNVKRGDMSIMLVRAFNLTNSSNTSESFSDVSQSSYYYDAIQTIKSLGIAQGDGQNFNPSNNMTLEEAILFVERALTAAEYDYSDTDISDLFAGRSLSDYATREDISAILYAVLGDDLENITTTTDDIDADAVTYTADEDTAITFEEEDFNDVCEDATDETLSYVKFTLPSTSYGTLYYDYESSSDYDSKVTASTKCYYDEDDGTYALSEVTFVPKSNYAGTVTISYTGYNTEGDSYTGTVVLTVNSDDTTADAVTYDTDEDTAITFDEEDFNDVCEDATDETLSYVKFTLPSTSYGKLYYDYESSSDYDSKVTASTKYYYDEDNGTYALSGVTFVPDSDYTGTVTISYTGYNTDGESFTGKIKITVE